MSGSSDSEEFFDAEDDTSHHRLSRRSRQKDKPPLESPNENSETWTKPSDVSVFVKPQDVPPLGDQGKVKSRSFVEKTEEDSKDVGANAISGRSRKFRDLRKRMQTEDDDIPVNNSPPDSQTSSIEGVYPSTASKTSHPFRKIEHDTLSLQSMTSLGRVGRILSGMSDSASIAGTSGTAPPLLVVKNQDGATSQSSSIPSREDESSSGKVSQSSSNLTLPGAVLKEDSREKEVNGKSEYSTPSQEEKATVFEEPNVIASMKNNTNGDSVSVNIPVAPPRRKKKVKSHSSSEVASSTQKSQVPVSTLPSPASTIESITREFEHSLDIRSATKGQYVVKPQDEDKSKAEGPSAQELVRLEKIEILQKGLTGKSNHASSASVSNHSIGRYSLGPHKFPGLRYQGSKERRKSAGDQDLVKQLNMTVRTRTDSGKHLTDMEILEQVTVLNLDTGEKVPLSIAEDKLPQCMNPLSLHIMRLTSEYVNNSSPEKEKESDEESVDSKMSSIPPDEDIASIGRVRKRTQKLKRFLGQTVKKTMNKAKSIAQEVSHARHKEEMLDMVDDVYSGDQQYIKLKASHSHKGPYEFDALQHMQDLEHIGSVWCMKFSACGRLLATAGQDRILRIWVLRDAYAYFQDMRTKYNAEKVSPTPSQESLVSQQSLCEDPNISGNSQNAEAESTKLPFISKPFCTYSGHTSALLDVSWSKNYFVLSSSMDKTVRLWHISRKECLCCFQHIDFVTAIVFHPRDDRYFLSGSLDGKIRLWNIPDKKVAVWNELDGQNRLITAANFCQNGKFAVVGSYDGRCIFYITDQMKYHTTIHVRSSRGKNATGRKISGIEPMPGEDKILVTSNDSRIRLYDLRDLNLSCKYKGYVSMGSQIKASFSPDGQYIVSGSENQCIYIWKTHHDYAKFSSVRRDRNDFWEGIKAHNAVVTCAVFAPNPDMIIKQIEAKENWEKKNDVSQKNEVLDPVVEQRTKGCGGHVLVSADFNGCVKVFLNKTKPKHSSLPASALT